VICLCLYLASMRWYQVSSSRTDDIYKRNLSSRCNEIMV